MSFKGRGQIGEEETSFRFETERIRDRTGIKRAATAATRDATITEDTTVDPLIRHLLALCSPTWLTHVFNRTLDFSFPSSTNAHPFLDSLSVLSNVHSNLRPKKQTKIKCYTVPDNQKAMPLYAFWCAEEKLQFEKCPANIQTHAGQWLFVVVARDRTFKTRHTHQAHTSTNETV